MAITQATIQNRRGPYADFDPQQMLPAEFAVVLSGDPDVPSGKSLYLAFGAGKENVRRLISIEDLEEMVRQDVFKGDKGDKGDPGASGKAGKDGASVSGANIDGRGHLMISLDNGTEYDAGPLDEAFALIEQATAAAGEAKTSAQEAKEAAQQTASDRATAEQAKTDAVAAKEDVEKSAKTASDAADTATTKAGDAETAKTAAELAAGNAQKSETAAQGYANTASGAADAATAKASEVTQAAETVAADKQAADKSATDAEASAKLAQSYATGDSGARLDEESDNAKEYARQAAESAKEAAEIAGGDFVARSEVGKPSGVASLDETGKVPEAQIPGIVTTINEETPTTLTGLLKGDGEHLTAAEADVDYVTRKKLNEKQDKLTGTSGQFVGFDSSGNAIAQEAPSGGADFATDEEIEEAKGYLTDEEPVWFEFELTSGTYYNTYLAMKNISGKTLNNVTVKFYDDYADKDNPNRYLEQAIELPAFAGTWEDQKQVDSEQISTSTDQALSLYVLVNDILSTTYIRLDRAGKWEKFQFDYTKPDLPDIPDKVASVAQIVEVIDKSLSEVVAKTYLKGNIEEFKSDIEHTVGTGVLNRFDIYSVKFGSDAGYISQGSNYHGSMAVIGARRESSNMSDSTGFLALSNASDGNLVLTSNTITAITTNHAFKLPIELHASTGSESSPHLINIATDADEHTIIRNISDPVQDQDVATKHYVDTHTPPGLTIQAITLSASAWNDDRTQTVACPGIVEDESKQFVSISPKLSDRKDCSATGIDVSAASTDSLTFSYEAKPDKDLTVYVAIQNAMEVNVDD